MPEELNYLGLDWGVSDVGVSFSDAETKIAFPLLVLKNDKDLLRKLGEIISQKSVGTIVVGIPFHSMDKSGSYEGTRLGEALNKLFSVDIAYQDEMFTTKMAEANLIDRGVKNISRFDDSEAARIILQEWLDRLV